MRALLDDDASYETFLASDDFSYGVAGVPDAEFEARWTESQPRSGS